MRLVEEYFSLPQEDGKVSQFQAWAWGMNSVSSAVRPIAIEARAISSSNSRPIARSSLAFVATGTPSRFAALLRAASILGSVVIFIRCFVVAIKSSVTKVYHLSISAGGDQIKGWESGYKRFHLTSALTAMININEVLRRSGLS